MPYELSEKHQHHLHNDGNDGVELLPDDKLAAVPTARSAASPPEFSLKESAGQRDTLHRHWSRSSRARTCIQSAKVILALLFASCFFISRRSEYKPWSGITITGRLDQYAHHSPRPNESQHEPAPSDDSATTPNTTCTRLGIRTPASMVADRLQWSRLIFSRCRLALSNP